MHLPNFEDEVKDMKQFTIVLAVSIILFGNVAVAAEVIIPLKLIKALPVEGPENNQPSGLTIFNNTLFTVSDKHDDTIFQIQLMDDKAILLPYIKFKLSEPITEKDLDFEGLTTDDEGNFYLISEKGFRILRVSANGEEVSWVTPSLKPIGEEEGLFQARGGYIEGIALVGKNQFVVCAERQPRGILEIDIGTTPHQIRAFKYDKTKVKLPEGRDADFTGLFSEDKTLYALQRSGSVICKLIHNGQEFEEKDFWSFEAIVNSEQLRYSDTRFGNAEGLCMDKNRVFVILDNNDDFRYADPNDRRPLLLIMERPLSSN